jgi:methionyl-tRNA formyltransferase
MKPRAIVFAYHDVGDRCLRALISHDWDVQLVVTHLPDRGEQRWFADVFATAAMLQIPCIAPETLNDVGLVRAFSHMQPDFVFSFYYRLLIPEAFLRQARRGALNMHGSLLPRYRGRAPVNWAILRGEGETGATLHHMTQRPDAGDIVDQEAVPILEDDDARAVMGKVTDAAEAVLVRSLPGLLDGTAPRQPQDLSKGEYCGRRTPEQGRIDWQASAMQIHNLVRAIAPPYPGAFTDVNKRRIWIHRTRRVPDKVLKAGAPRLYGENGRCFIACQDGRVLEFLAGATSEGVIVIRELASELAAQPWRLS